MFICYSYYVIRDPIYHMLFCKAKKYKSVHIVRFSIAKTLKNRDNHDALPEKTTDKKKRQVQLKKVLFIYNFNQKLYTSGQNNTCKNLIF